MSLRDMFSKTKKKRSRTPTSEPSESNRSFVNNVKSRVSGLVPARISQWFSSTPRSSPGNGSTPTADVTDSSEDEPELIPPAKRKRFNSLESQYNQCLQVEPTPFHAEVSDIPNTHHVLYTSIQSSSERKTLVRDTNYASTRYVSDVDESNMETVTLDVPDRDTTYKSLHIPSTSVQSVATKRKSIFESVGNPKDDMKTIKPCPPTITLPSNIRPRFRSSLYGSPFYPGPTMYGGASASMYNNYPVIKQQKAVTVRESNKTPNCDLSSSTRRILDILENFSSPMIEARRIPVIKKRSPLKQSDTSDLSVPSTSKSISYKTQQLNVPSIASILRLKQRSRMMDTNKIARQIIASHSSTLQSFHPYTDIPNSETSWSTEKESTPKLKTRLTRPNRGEDPLAMPEPVQLPTAVLHIDKDNLPKFSITSPAGVTTVLTTASTQSELPSTYKPQATSEPNTTTSLFTKTVATTKSHSSMFKFASPAASPVAITQDLQITNETTSHKAGWNINESKVWQETQRSTFITNKEESLVITSTPNSLTGWQCSECSVNNKAHVDECVACGGKQSSAADMCAQGERAPALSLPSTSHCMESEKNDWKCDNCWIKNKSDANKCAACGGSKPDGSESAISRVHTPTPTPHVNNPEGDWKCENCWIKNKSSVKKCAACGGSKPDGKESAASAALVKQPEEDWKCDNCWIVNKSSVKKCAACGGSKPGEKEVAVPALKPEFHSPFAKAPDAKLQEIMSEQKKKWECPGCLIRNDPDQTKCQCCEMERAGPSKEKTLKPFTFPKESNIHFKFGIDPKEQQKNIANKTEQGAKLPASILGQTEANNNTYVVKFPSLGKSDEKMLYQNQQDDNDFENMVDSVVPEHPKMSFLFGFPRAAPENSSPAVAPSIDKPKFAQESLAFGAGFLSPPKSEQATKIFTSFLGPSTSMPSADSTSMTSADSQQNAAAPIASSITNNTVPNETKEAYATLRFTDRSADKGKPFSFGGESHAGAGSSVASTSFSFAGPSAGPSNALFASPQPTTALNSSAGNMFGGNEPAMAASTATPHFNLRNDGPNATPTFSFGSTQQDNKAPFSFKASTSFSMGAAATLPSSTLGGNAGSMASSMSGMNETSTVPSTSGFRPQESAWGANEDAKFGASAAPFAFGASNNQFGVSGAGVTGTVPTLFGAPPAASAQTQNMFGMSSGAPGTSGSGGMFGNAPQPAQAATLFGAQPAPAVFGSSASAQPPAFGAPAPTQTPAFGASALNQPSGFGAPATSQPPAFGIPSPSQAPTFGNPAQSQSLAFNTPAPSQPSAFGSPIQSQPPAFGTPSQMQLPAFGAPSQSQLSAFGAPTQNQTPAFGAPAQNQTPAFGVPTQSQPLAFGAPLQNQTPAFGAPAQNQTPAFGAPALGQPPAFGAPTQSQSPVFGAHTQNQAPAFGAPTQNQLPTFGMPAPSQPLPFGAPSQPAAAGPAFNFGSGVFNFGQQAQPQPQPSNIYSFGGGNAMGGMGGEMNMSGGMMAHPMDGGMGGSGQFNVGSAPASGRRMRKAVRRTQQR